MDERWAELGIAPTDDPAAIRRAYAVRLRQIRPDIDPAGFITLRAAYEAALAKASASAARALPDGAADPAAEATDEAVFPEPQQPDPSIRDASKRSESARADTETRPLEFGDPAVRAILEAMARGDVVAAAEGLATARGTVALSLHEDMVLADRLLEHLVDDDRVSGAAVIEAAERLEWDDSADLALHQPKLDRLRARVEAERWLARLRRKEAGRLSYLGNSEAVATRLLFGRGPVAFSWMLPPDVPLLPTMRAFERHAPWVEAAFEPRRIVSLTRIAAQWKAGPIRVLPMAVLAAAFLAPLLVFPTNLLGLYCVLAVFAYRRLHAYLRLIVAALVLLVAGATLLPRLTPQGSGNATIDAAGPVAHPRGSGADTGLHGWRLVQARRAPK